MPRASASSSSPSDLPRWRSACRSISGISPVWAIPCALAFIAAGWLGSGIRVSLSPLGRVAGATVAAAIAVGLLAGLVLPRLDALWPGRQIARAFAANRPCPDSVLASAGYIEPSLVFLTATDTLLTDGAGAANHLKSSACAVAAVDANESQRLHGRLRWVERTTAGRWPGRRRQPVEWPADCRRALPAAGELTAAKRGGRPPLPA